MNTLKVKILGSGNAAQKHARAFTELSELYTVTDSSDHDIVDICTANWMHYQQTCEALRSGKHAIVEKPICGSLAECDELYRLSRKTGKLIFPVFQYRFANDQRLYKDIKTFWPRDHEYYATWRGDWTKAVGGCLTSHGIHSIDLFIRLNGMPRAVNAWISPRSGPVETFGCIELTKRKFVDGRFHNDFKIWVSTEPETEKPAKEVKLSKLGDSHSGFVTQFHHIYHDITEELPPSVGLAEARQSLEVLTAAYWSAYTGEPAMLPIGPDHPFYRGWSEAFAERMGGNTKLASNIPWTTPKAP